MNKTALNALQAYTKDFYSDTDFQDSSDNIVGSPLGSWMLLASAASAFDYTGKDALKKATEDRLHMSIEAAVKTVAEIKKEYTSLNYVSQAWSADNRLAPYPNVRKWVDANTMIPYQPTIPTQEDINAWALKHSKGLIKEFPMQMTEDTLLVVANIIYSNLQWEAPFNSITALDGGMEEWNVPHILRAQTTLHDVLFCSDDNEDIFAIYQLRAKGDNKEHMRLITCLTREAEPNELMDALHNVDSFNVLLPSDERLNHALGNMYSKGDPRSHEIRVAVPAWEAAAKYDLLENKRTGYTEIIQALNNDGEDDTFDSIEAKQVTVAKFDKEGFEAAALTTFGVASRCMPLRPYTLNFNRPFVFTSYIGKLPIFSGYIKTAKDGV